MAEKPKYKFKIKEKKPAPAPEKPKYKFKIKEKKPATPSPKSPTPNKKTPSPEGFKEGDQVIYKGKQYLVTSFFDARGDTMLSVKDIKSEPYYKSSLDKEKKIRTLTLEGFNHRVKSGEGSDRTIRVTRLVRKAKQKVDLEKNNPDARDNVMPAKNFKAIYKDVFEKHKDFKPT